jgi:signal transduction histidine kinase
MAKIEYGGEVLRIQPLEPGLLVHDVAAMLRARAEMKRLALLVETPAFPVPVQADSAKLRRILINLVSNAIRYTEKGSVTLRVTSRTAGAAGRVSLTFEVADTGIGIAADDQARIFGAFVQLDTGRKQRGTGLGLTITRHLVDLMGGTIQLESAPGAGSRVGLRRYRNPKRWD